MTLQHPPRFPHHTTNRTQRLRTYRRCFPGTEGVKWLVSSGHAPDEAGAAALGNAMVQAGLLHHVAYEHTFRAGDLLYKFTVDDEAGHVHELSKMGSSQLSMNNSLSGALSGAGTPQQVPGTPTAAAGLAGGSLQSAGSGLL